MASKLKKTYEGAVQKPNISAFILKKLRKLQTTSGRMAGFRTEV
jgi:hypothetical protein